MATTASFAGLSPGHDCITASSMNFATPGARRCGYTSVIHNVNAGLFAKVGGNVPSEGEAALF